MGGQRRGQQAPHRKAERALQRFHQKCFSKRRQQNRLRSMDRSRTHKALRPTDFESWQGLFFVLPHQVFTRTYTRRAWHSFAIFPRPSPTNSHSSAIVLGPRFRCGSWTKYVGTGSRTEVGQTQIPHFENPVYQDLAYASKSPSGKRGHRRTQVARLVDIKGRQA
jgi:hypothetical protein